MYTHYNLTDLSDWMQCERYNRYKVNPRVEENHKYQVDMVGLWDIGEYTGTPGDLVLGKVKSRLLNTGGIVPKYQIEVLSEGLYKGRFITVSEKMALEEIDPTPYLPLDTNKPKINEPIVSTPARNSSPFTCDIEELKTDISDLRTDIDSLLKSQCKLEGDILVAKQPEIELNLADDGGLTVKEEVEQVIHDHTVEVTSQIDELHDEIDKTSKMAKLSLLSQLISI